jgi:hypothetical protein
MYTKNDLKASVNLALAFSSVLREPKFDGQELKIGAKRTLSNKNVVLQCTSPAHGGQIWVEVAYIDRFLGEQLIAKGEEFLLPEGKKVIVTNGGRLALA